MSDVTPNLPAALLAAASRRTPSSMTGAICWIAPATAGRGYAAVRPFGGTFGTPEPVTPDEAVQEVAFIAAPSGGSFTAAWVARPSGTDAVVREAAVRRLDGRLVLHPLAWRADGSGAVEMRAAVFEEAVKGSQWPDRLDLEVLAER